MQGLRSCIPPNFPYFAAEIGLSSGHVHVIDDEDSFPDDFGRGVLVGLLQLSAEQMHKRAKQESHSIQVRPCFHEGSHPHLHACSKGSLLH